MRKEEYATYLKRNPLLSLAIALIFAGGCSIWLAVMIYNDIYVELDYAEIVPISIKEACNSSKKNPLFRDLIVVYEYNGERHTVSKHGIIFLENRNNAIIIKVSKVNPEKISLPFGLLLEVEILCIAIIFYYAGWRNWKNRFKRSDDLNNDGGWGTRRKKKGQINKGTIQELINSRK
jgi:hypothetical protein